ncbi:MAG: hypothetical protein SCARUB_02460, partial [Candidatus Scalindua rubra]
MADIIVISFQTLQYIRKVYYLTGQA